MDVELEVKNPDPNDVHVVVNCGHPAGPRETHVRYGDVAVVVERHRVENTAAAEAAHAEHLRLRAEREAAQKAAAEAAERTAAQQSAALSELRARAQSNPDLALMARVLGINV